MGDKVQNLDFCPLLCHFADLVPDFPLQQLSKKKAECTSGATETIDQPRCLPYHLRLFCQKSQFSDTPTSNYHSVGTLQYSTLTENRVQSALPYVFQISHFPLASLHQDYRRITTVLQDTMVINLDIKQEGALKSTCHVHLGTHIIKLPH